MSTILDPKGQPIGTSPKCRPGTIQTLLDGLARDCETRAASDGCPANLASRLNFFKAYFAVMTAIFTDPYSGECAAPEGVTDRAVYAGLNAVLNGLASTCYRNGDTRVTPHPAVVVERDALQWIVGRLNPTQGGTALEQALVLWTTATTAAAMAKNPLSMSLLSHTRIIAVETLAVRSIATIGE